jgi:hypothetical protein
LQSVNLLFPNCPLSKKKRYGMIPCTLLLSVCLSVCLSVSHCLSVFCVNVAFERKLHMYTLCMFHSILIHTYTRTYIHKHT